MKADSAAAKGTLTTEELENVVRILPDYKSRVKPKPPSKPKRKPDTTQSLNNVF